MSAKWHFAFKTVSISTIVFRTMLLPMFEDTTQIMMMVNNLFFNCSNNFVIYILLPVVSFDEFCYSNRLLL